MDNYISSSLPDKKINAVFKEVHHQEKLGLLNPEQLRLFHLQVSNNRFVFSSLEEYLTNIISEYVFSRVQIERLTDPSTGMNPMSIGIKALRAMKKNGAADQKGTGNELGEILLYAFLEEILGAPKIFSKVELNAVSTPFGKESDSVHLLQIDDTPGMSVYQTVFGTSRIQGDIQDAIDNAFDAIMRIEQENGQGIQLLARNSLREFFDIETAARLTKTIIPQPNDSVINERAYGIFLGYTLGLNPENRSNAEFRQALDKKMEEDIRHHVTYIANKIKRLNLETKSFYIYFVPFNDAEVDKKQVMEDLMM